MRSISVIIASLNGEKTLPEALQSIAIQEYDGALEVLLADNGSTDRTREVFQAFSSANPGLACRVVDASARRGKAFALNTAIAQATGDWLLFLDDDDAWAPGYLAAMARALSEHPFVAARFDCAALNPPDLYPLRAREERGIGRANFPPHAGLAAGGTLGFHRAVFDRVDGFRAELPRLADIDFCIRAAIAGYELRLVPEAVYRYRYRSDAAETYRQARAYAETLVALQGRYAGASLKTRVSGWIALAFAYLKLLAWRARRLFRPMSRFETFWFAMRRGRLDGLRAGALRTGFAPTLASPPGVGRLRRIAERLRSAFGTGDHHTGSTAK